MPDKLRPLSIEFSAPVASQGLHLVQGVAEGHLWPNATVIPAEMGGSACYRTAPTGGKRRHVGYWRGETEESKGTADAFLIKLDKPIVGPREAFLTVEFFETEIGWLAAHYYCGTAAIGTFVHHVCPHEHRGLWDHTWVNTGDSNTWQRATIRLVYPLLNGRGPLGSDIRIVSSGPLAIRRVTLSSEQPPDFDETSQMGHARRLEKLFAPRFPKASIPVSMGNVGYIPQDDSGYGDMVPWLPVYKAMGFTACQSFVSWSRIERTEGEWDWTFYDWVVAEAKRFGLKWIAFIMIGPWYAMPTWWLASAHNKPNKCLEHDEESWVQSIWNPDLAPYVERFMMKFAEHYPEELLESIMVGIAGDYGESTTNGVFLPNWYHTHLGWWCGEDIAVEDLRRVMRHKYGTIEALNNAWDTAYADFVEIRPFLRDNAPSDRAWVDMANWVIDQMTWLMKQWGEICRRALPNTTLFNAAGGAGDPPRASHWTDQTAALAETSKMGHRVTNEGGDFAFNYAYTALPGHCCRFYGVPFGNEPWGGDMEGNAMLARIYNAITQHATNLYFYAGLLRWKNAWTALERGLPYLTNEYRRTNRVAVWYPWTHFVVIDEYGFSEKGMRDKFWPQVEELRDIIDFDFVDDHLVRDGAMKDFDFLIVLQGTAYEKAELERIVAWVKAGGVLITHKIGVPATIEGDSSLGEELMSFGGEPTELENMIGARIAAVGKGRVVAFQRCANVRGWHGDPRWKDDHKDHPATNPKFWTMIARTLSNASRLGNGMPDYPVVDGDQNEVFGTMMTHRGRPGILYLSQMACDVEVHPIIPGKGRISVTVPSGQLHWVCFDDLV